MNYRGPLFSLCLMIAAGIWGYKRIDIKEWWQSAFQASSRPIAQPLAPDNPTASNPPDTSITTPLPQLPSPTPAMPSLPYSKMQPSPMPPGTDPSLHETLESIGTGATNEKKRERRNLYFEKLSQQLKELQGDKKAETAPPGQPPPPGSPASFPRSPVTPPVSQPAPTEPIIEPDDEEILEDEELIPETLNEEEEEEEDIALEESIDEDFDEDE